MVADLPLLPTSVVFEGGGPVLESLEGDGEGVLSWHQTVTLIDHCLHPPEHILGLMVPHLVDPVVGGPNVLGSPVVEVNHVLAGDVGDIHILSDGGFTSVFMIRWGGIWAIGSGGGGWPSIWWGLTI